MKDFIFALFEFIFALCTVVFILCVVFLAFPWVANFSAKYFKYVECNFFQEEYIYMGHCR